MSFVELLLVAVGLSMDAFAVSVCKGLSVKKLGVKHALILKRVLRRLPVSHACHRLVPRLAL